MTTVASHFLGAGTGRLHVLTGGGPDGGPGPAVCLVHGNLSTAQFFAATARALPPSWSRRYRRSATAVPRASTGRCATRTARAPGPGPSTPGWSAGSGTRTAARTARYRRGRCSAPSTCGRRCGSRPMTRTCSWTRSWPPPWARATTRATGGPAPTGPARRPAPAGSPTACPSATATCPDSPGSRRTGRCCGCAATAGPVPRAVHRLRQLGRGGAGLTGRPASRSIRAARWASGPGGISMSWKPSSR